MSSSSSLSLSSVHCSFRQDLLHAGALLLRRLLHHPALLCLDLPRQNLDRLQIPACHEAHVRPRHPPVPQHPQDNNIYQVTLKPINESYSHLFFQACSASGPLCVCVANWCWSCSLGQKICPLVAVISVWYNIFLSVGKFWRSSPIHQSPNLHLLECRLLPHGHHVHW